MRKIKTLLVAVNSKYIHTNPAVRILTKVASKEHNINFVEFTIKDNIENIIDKINSYDILGFSCYIWNISIIKEIAVKIKAQYPNIIIFAGGPEVSFEPSSFTDYFDYIICGEGEEIISPFLHCLERNLPTNIDGIATKKNPDVLPYFTKDLKNVPDIFDMYSKDDLENRVIYLELSRGCPFNCSYCLSSVEKGVRLFSKKHNENTFKFIENNIFKCVKFLDRTFNINPKRFIDICKRLEKTNNEYQFEIEASLFSDEVIDYLCNVVTPHKFRLEIGIQSFNDDAIKSVNRNQNNEKLYNTIKLINNSGRCTIHIDLIAGLPYETLDSFKSSFNMAFSLKCEELQLGFLKMLRGTQIRKEAYKFSYTFSQTEPYEIIKNEFMSEYDLNIIHKCEESLEWLWNGKNAISLINHLYNENSVNNWFDFFVGFYPYYNKKLSLNKNYESLLKYLKDINLLNKNYIDDLKSDYLKKVKIRPQPFWKDYAYEDFKKLKNYLFENFGINKNSFSTSYYDGFIIIDYNKNKPVTEIFLPDKSQ